MKILLPSVATALITASCGVEANHSGLASSAGDVDVKLYQGKDHVPTPGCDVFTSLRLSPDGKIQSAKLENKVAGFCEIYVVPNPRQYTVSGKPGKCNSVVYTGARRVAIEGQPGADGIATIKITDYRRNTCDFDFGGNFVVEETSPTGAVVLYSYDGK